MCVNILIGIRKQSPWELWRSILCYCYLVIAVTDARTACIASTSPSDWLKDSANMATIISFDFCITTWREISILAWCYFFLNITSRLFLSSFLVGFYYTWNCSVVFLFSSFCLCYSLILTLFLSFNDFLFLHLKWFFFSFYFFNFLFH